MAVTRASVVNDASSKGGRRRIIKLFTACHACRPYLRLPTALTGKLAMSFWTEIEEVLNPHTNRPIGCKCGRHTIGQRITAMAPGWTAGGEFAVMRGWIQHQQVDYHST